MFLPLSPVCPIPQTLLKVKEGLRFEKDRTSQRYLGLELMDGWNTHLDSCTLKHMNRYLDETTGKTLGEIRLDLETIRPQNSQPLVQPAP